MQMHHIMKIASQFGCAAILSVGLICTPVAAATQENPGLPVTSNGQTTLYGIGSISKVFATAAAMKLAEDGLLDLDAPVVQYIPDFTMKDGRYTSITVRMLLNHSSGLQGSCYQNSILLGDNDPFTQNTFFQQLSRQRLKAEPGAFSVYCNDGFTLLERIIEEISGMGFTEFLDVNFIGPLGLTHTKTPQSNFDRDSLAPIYWDSAVQLPPESCNTIASGGIYATAEDLCRFAQLFTNAGDTAVLGFPSAEETFAPAYIGESWKGIPDAGSFLAYGLGWDTINAYPFGSHGIRAASKGGDTSAYHAALTVLPDEGATCAVLSSGGSGSFCDAAVQEILLEYLRETGRIAQYATLTPSVDPAGVPMPQETRSYEGWYATNTQAMHVQMSGEDTLLLRSAGTERDTEQKYVHIGDQVFQSTQGAYIATDGTLAKAQFGAYGSTKITFSENDDGTPILTAEISETIPGIGSKYTCIPFAQQIYEKPLSGQIKAAWEERTDKRYYLNSEKYSSVYYLSSPCAQLRFIDGLPGYVTMDSGPYAVFNRIEDSKTAQFFQQIPGVTGRDLSDIRFFEDNGAEYMELQIGKFISEDAIKPFDALPYVTIPENGEAQWFSAQFGKASSVSISIQGKGNFFIYSQEKDELLLTASSLTSTAGNEINLPIQCRAVFAGDPGAKFQIHWKS